MDVKAFYANWKLKWRGFRHELYPMLSHEEITVLRVQEFHTLSNKMSETEKMIWDRCAWRDDGTKYFKPFRCVRNVY